MSLTIKSRKYHRSSSFRCTSSLIKAAQVTAETLS